MEFYAQLIVSVTNIIIKQGNWTSSGWSFSANFLSEDQDALFTKKLSTSIWRVSINRNFKKEEISVLIIYGFEELAKTKP